MNKRCQVMCEQGVGVGNDELVLFCSILSPQSQLATYYSPLVERGRDSMQKQHMARPARQPPPSLPGTKHPPDSARQKTNYHALQRVPHTFLTATRLMTAWFSEDASGMRVAGGEKRASGSANEKPVQSASKRFLPACTGVAAQSKGGSRTHPLKIPDQFWGARGE